MQRYDPGDASRQKKVTNLQKKWRAAENEETDAGMSFYDMQQGREFIHAYVRDKATSVQFDWMFFSILLYRPESFPHNPGREILSKSIIAQRHYVCKNSRGCDFSPRAIALNKHRIFAIPVGGQEDNVI